jgi:hypothetical protein
MTNTAKLTTTAQILVNKPEHHQVANGIAFWNVLLTLTMIMFPGGIFLNATNEKKIVKQIVFKFQEMLNVFLELFQF